MLDQSFQDFELLVIDDGSTDDSRKIVQEFNDSRIRLKSIKNSGVSVARNFGVEKSKYDWIAFLDADDYWTSGFLETLWSAIQDHPDNKLFATGRSRIFKSDSERYQHEFLPPDGDVAVLNYFQTISKYLPLINSSNVVVDKGHYLAEGGFNAGMKRHEDHDLWIRLAKHEPVVFINKDLSRYRKTETGTGSGEIFRAGDFINYIQTIKKVKNQLSEEEQLNFKKYYDRFSLISYIQNCAVYTGKENNSVYEELSGLLEGAALKRLKWIHRIPIKKLYPVYKKLKKGK